MECALVVGVGAHMHPCQCIPSTYGHMARQSLGGLGAAGKGARLAVFNIVQLCWSRRLTLGTAGARGCRSWVDQLYHGVLSSEEDALLCLTNCVSED